MDRRWHQMLQSLAVAERLRGKPAVVITSLQGRHVVPYTLLAAAGILAIAIPAVAALTLNRYIVSGLLAGSVR